MSFFAYNVTIQYEQDDFLEAELPVSGRGTLPQRVERMTQRRTDVRVRLASSGRRADNLLFLSSRTIATAT